MINKKLLEKIKHELTTQDGLYVTDVQKEAEKMNPSIMWQLNHKELIDEVDQALKKKTVGLII